VIRPSENYRTKVDGSEFESLVAELLTSLAADEKVPAFRLEKQERIETHDGDYRIDITARFSHLGVNFLAG